MRAGALLAAAFVLAGCAVGSSTRTVTLTRTVTSRAAPAGKGALAQTQNARYFGIPVLAQRLDAHRYALSIKPELFLVGVTANVAFAAQQQNACRPLECPGVQDDRLVLPAGSRNLLFILPATTTGTVLTLSHEQMRTTPVTGAQLAAIVGCAKSPKLVEPLDSGIWLTVDVDKVTSFAQQFQP